jgi:sugar phosphate isomerase/epimerase
MDGLITSHIAGVVLLEASPGAPLLVRGADVDALLEACFAAGADAALLHATSLPPAFFDLSSGVAGEVLQKLRQYGVRCAVVAPAGAGATPPTARFREMAAEARRGGYFAVFDTVDAARHWLTHA